MKVFGKWIVMGTNKDKTKTGIAASFKTRREAVNTLNELFTNIDSNEWIDSVGHSFYIEKNTVEY